MFYSWEILDGGMYKKRLLYILSDGVVECNE